MELCQLSSFSEFQSKREAAQNTNKINSNKGGDQLQFIKVSVTSREGDLCCLVDRGLQWAGRVPTKRKSGLKFSFHSENKKSNYKSSNYAYERHLEIEFP